MSDENKKDEKDEKNETKDEPIATVDDDGFTRIPLDKV